MSRDTLMTYTIMSMTKHSNRTEIIGSAASALPSQPNCDLLGKKMLEVKTMSTSFSKVSVGISSN